MRGGATGCAWSALQRRTPAPPPALPVRGCDGRAFVFGDTPVKSGGCSRVQCYLRNPAQEAGSDGAAGRVDRWGCRGTSAAEPADATSPEAPAVPKPIGAKASPLPGASWFSWRIAPTGPIASWFSCRIASTGLTASWFASRLGFSPHSQWFKPALTAIPAASPARPWPPRASAPRPHALCAPPPAPCAPPPAPCAPPRAHVQEPRRATAGRLPRFRACQ